MSNGWDATGSNLVGVPVSNIPAPNNISYTASGGSSSMDLQTLFDGQMVDVRSFGAIPNDMTFDQSAAFNAAIASLSATTGGTIWIPRGTYKANIVVNQNNVHLMGESMLDVSTGTSYIQPYNVALPTIKVCDDTKRVNSFRLSNISLYGGDATGTGQIGLQINGGMNGAWIRNFSARNFGDHGLKIGPGSAYEIQWVFFDGIIIRTPAAGNPVGIGLYYGTAPSWLTVCYFKNYKIESGGAFGFAVIADSVKAGFDNGWMQVGYAHGIKFQNNYAGSTPLLYGVENTVEAAGGQVCVEVYNTSKRKADFFNGQWHLTELIKLSDTTTYTPNGDWSFGSKTELYLPVIQNAYIADTSTPTQTNLHLKATGNSLQLVNDDGGSMSLTSSNNADFASNQIRATTIGYGFSGKVGTNAKFGTATLVNGTVTVSCTSVTANSMVRVYRQGINASTALGELTVPTKTAGASFVVTSITAGGNTTQTGDASTFAYEVFEHIP